ncbi:unnamed protein product [Orchesella dallaii]|uniref:Uncharacterized protein n=1 Tax=Orchesella dallaii TaxID=48710 RepID=A0ABP1S9R8_9HEXA
MPPSWGWCCKSLFRRFKILHGEKGQARIWRMRMFAFCSGNFKGEFELKGPCPDGQWLVFEREFRDNESKNAICAIRSCPESNAGHLKFWFEYKGKCYQTETVNEEFCGNDKQKIYFALDKPEPICMDKRPVILSLGGVKVNKRRRIRRGKKSKGCPTGFKELRNGDCRRVPKKYEDDDSSDDSDDYSDEHSKESYKGSLGYGPYKGALGFEPHQGALGYEPHEGALGFEPHKGALGYEPHEGALGFEPHEGSLGYGPYKG